ncbi:MAG TPA: hypothetical protein VM029_21885, partial [Opitutaceae bacterium]|nr:hypothetical protein [Opitutaceae bacterium]
MAPAKPVPVAPPTPAIAQKVEAEMTRLLYRSAGFGLFSNVVLALILVGGTLRAHPSRLHVAWLGAMLFVSLVRLGLNLAFFRHAPASDDLPRWRTLFLLGSTAAGLIWGAAGWYYFATEEPL